MCAALSLCRGGCAWRDHRMCEARDCGWWFVFQEIGVCRLHREHITTWSLSNSCCRDRDFDHAVKGKARLKFSSSARSGRCQEQSCPWETCTVTAVLAEKLRYLYGQYPTYSILSQIRRMLFSFDSSLISLELTSPGLTGDLGGATKI
jgi:hypothetical protein